MNFFINKKQGQAAIMVSICLVGIISLLALVVDTGRIFVEHAKLQRGVDAAVLAAAQDLPIGKNGKDESDIDEIVMTALAYNLNNSKQEYTKDANLNRYLLIDNNETNTVTLTKEEFNINNAGDNFTVDIQYLTPANSIDGKKTVISVTVGKKIKTRLANFLGYSEWWISAQQIAIIGPIKTVPEMLPLGILVDNDENGVPIELPIGETVRLTNTKHDSGVDKQYTYVPIYGLSTKKGSSFEGYTDTNKDSARTRTIIGSGDKNFIYTSAIKNAQELKIINKEKSEDVFLGICEGFNELIAESVFESSTGCINTDESIDEGKIDYNFAFGSISSMFGYEDDPRLFILPVIQYSSNYTHHQDYIGNRQREFKIIGFTLFFYEYGHYTSHPATTEYYGHDENGQKITPAMMEMVGFFTPAIFEGPIDLTTKDYGISGIQYVSPTDETLFTIEY